MRPRIFCVAVITVVVITFVGAVWETASVGVFANRAGGLKGMVANPRPYDYVNYDYTPQGRHYEFWAFKMPLAGTASLLIVVGIIFTLALARAKRGGRAFALWAIIVMCGTIFFALTACYYVAAVNVFI